MPDSDNLVSADGFRRSRACPPLGACVEVKIDRDAVRVRQTGKPEKTLNFTRGEWQAFLAGAKKGEFDI